jgi:hypothetical protein
MFNFIIMSSDLFYLSQRPTHSEKTFRQMRGQLDTLGFGDLLTQMSVQLPYLYDREKNVEFPAKLRSQRPTGPPNLRARAEVDHDPANVTCRSYPGARVFARV